MKNKRSIEKSTNKKKSKSLSLQPGQQGKKRDDVNYCYQKLRMDNVQISWTLKG